MDINNPQHTFAVCAYKESPFLEECIQSLIAQKSDSKIIIATSTPNEHIKNIAAKYNLPVFENPAESSIGGDWNFALSKVKTPYVTFAHQDDVYLSGFYKRTMAELQRPNCLIAFTNYEELKHGSPIKLTINLRIKDMMLFGFRFFKRCRLLRRLVFSVGNPICCPAVSYNLTKLGEFKFDQSLKVNLDWDAWIRIGAKKGRFGYISKRLMQHRIHEGSETTNAIKNNSRSTEDYDIFRRFWPKFIAERLSKIYDKSQDTN